MHNFLFDKKDRNIFTKLLPSINFQQNICNGFTEFGKVFVY